MLTDLSIKINFKLGGTSHNIAPNGSAFHKKLFAGAREDTMIVGADVTHPQKKLQNCPSIAAVVAQHEPNSSHFYGAVRLQQGRQEVSNNVTKCFDDTKTCSTLPI